MELEQFQGGAMGVATNGGVSLVLVRNIACFELGMNARGTIAGPLAR
jgi:hypothetical protein